MMWMLGQPFWGVLLAASLWSQIQGQMGMVALTLIWAWLNVNGD